MKTNTKETENTTAYGALLGVITGKLNRTEADWLVRQALATCYGPPAEDKPNVSEPVITEVYLPIDQRVELCKKILATIAGLYPTPEETYGANLVWAIGDLMKCVDHLKVRLDAPQPAPTRAGLMRAAGNLPEVPAERRGKPGWLLPRKGDKVLVVRDPETYTPCPVCGSGFKVGDVATVASNATQPYQPNNTTKWPQECEPYLIVEDKTKLTTWQIPLACFEPVVD